MSTAADRYLVEFSNQPRSVSMYVTDDDDERERLQALGDIAATTQHVIDVADGVKMALGVLGGRVVGTRGST